MTQGFRSFKASVEKLETRDLMAVDVTSFHNLETPEDVDGSGDVSPLDVLSVVNAVNSPTTENISFKMADVDADWSVTPLDVLVVVNHLNRRSANPNQLQPSTVPIEQRIRRIEQSIHENMIDSNFTLQHAIDVLATLRAGGRPEIGQVLEQGVVVQRELQNGVIDPSRGALFERIQSLTEKLSEAGVTREVISTITTEIRNAYREGQPLTLIQIKDRLVELGVDLSKIFPPANESPPVERPLVSWVRAVVGRLENAGVTLEVIDTIVREVRSSIESGDPLSLLEIRDRLIELGVDVSKLRWMIPFLPRTR